jgi:large subunit ribosomal protein L32e
MRKKRGGWPKSVNIGYGGPRNARNLHPSGFEDVLVYNVSQIEGLNPESQAVRIAHTVGEKKRREILTKARERRIRVLNPRELKEAPPKEIEQPEVSKEEGKAEAGEIGEEGEAVGEELEEEKEKPE